ncbi:hypothetical protein [Lysobacter enzymogenes]|uniref:hypothetical protein n=1 Tax=Lysobacter enzymogenes TaxID=69 RepID=UPI000F4C146A|nr:hypothetical protein [Lysobacter enzymogenes]
MQVRGSARRVRAITQPQAGMAVFPGFLCERRRCYRCTALRGLGSRLGVLAGMCAACEGGAILDTVVPAKAGIRFAFVFARYVQQWERQGRIGFRLSPE